MPESAEPGFSFFAEDPSGALTAVEVITPDLPLNSFYYFVPQKFEELDLGWLVVVELGRRKVGAWVVRTLPVEDARTLAREAMKSSREEKGTEEKLQQSLFGGEALEREVSLKPILGALHAFPKELFKLYQWMSDYYGSPLAEILDTAMPIPPKVVNDLGTTKKTRKRASKEKPDPASSPFASVAPSTLTPHQDRALTAIQTALRENSFSPFLLHGVTGSGKTEVYLRALECALALGKTAMIIVPEIALTPQLVGHFQSRLNVPLGILHSQIGSSERWQTWKDILNGEVRVVIGARSAVFAPLADPGLIIVDEEHETSYKQSDGLRYHGRDLAILRAKFSSSVVVLGSATPSFESLVNAAQRRYKLLEMPERATTRPLPSIEIVDLSKIRAKEMPSPNLSPQLHALISLALEKKEQIVLLYNRRGFATYMQCGTCSEVLLCPHCSVTLTYHRGKSRVLCHYCDYSAAAPRFCGQCRDTRTVRFEDDAGKELKDFPEDFGKMEQRGAGTERIVTELQTLYPAARLLQMDRDTVGSKDSYEQILGAMKKGEADILVGTQMIAKGHDLPGVTLVGIIDADVGLHMPDFRSSERIFQLITQASGRAGRGESAGRVVIQTREPNHPTIVAVATGRFRAFARYELDFRKKLHYPPFGKLMRIVVSATKPDDALAASGRIAGLLRELVSRIDSENGAAKEADDAKSENLLNILGPAPAPLERLRGRFRFHLLVKCASAKHLSRISRELQVWKKMYRGEQEFRMTVDIDPQEML